MFLLLSCPFIAALWSPTGKGLTYWLLFVVLTVCCVTFPCGIPGQVWYLIVLFPDICYLSYLHCVSFFLIFHYQKKSLAKGLFWVSIYFYMSLEYNSNSKGPQMTASVIPDEAGAQSDFTPFTTDCCCLKHKKEFINFNVAPPIP